MFLASGKHWKLISSINSIRINNIYTYKWESDLTKNSFVSLFNQKNDLHGSLYGFNFKNDIYYFYELLIGEKNSNMVSSGIGYQNDWVNIQIGKGSEDWGSGRDINLALNETSKPFDYFSLSSNYGKMRVNYIHGVLGKTSSDINRYINVRGFEWNNNKNANIAFSETIIYSGQNRPIDLSYLNPINSHLEIELNDRSNFKGYDNANAVWQIHLDFLLKDYIRIAFNYLIDEFVFDQDIEIGKENGLAYSAELSKTIFYKKSSLLSVALSKVFVGTPTFRHGNGQNNFINNNKPLGWQYGSDGREFTFKIDYLSNDRYFLRFALSNVLLGEESILNNPYKEYEDYQAGKFPYGELLSFIKANAVIDYMFSPRIQFSISSMLKKTKNNFDLRTRFGLIVNIK